MHEMAIAQSILEIVAKVAQKQQFSKVTSIQLAIGEMTGIEVEALEFCFEIVAKNTPAEQAKLVVNKKPLVAYCLDCKQSFPVERYRFICPHCQSAQVEIQSGRELQVEALEGE